MGVQGFTKVFSPHREIKLKDLKGKNVGIDAHAEIYRAALGMSKSQQLTNSAGHPTNHINVVLSFIMKLYENNINQYWFFDFCDKEQYDKSFHNPMKELELKKRLIKKQKASQKLKELKDKEEQLKNKSLNEEEYLFSSSEDEKENLIKEMDKCERAAFKLHEFYIQDIIFILNSLEIPWVVAPAGFEAEQLAAIATYDARVLGVKLDYVLTPDADALIFGAEKLIKRDTRKGKFFEYDLDKLLREYDITYQDLIKISLILGTDFAPKTPKIGIKTVLKKFKGVILSEIQQKAFNEQFNRDITTEEVSSINIQNNENAPFTNLEKFTEFIEWITLIKSYNKDRILKYFTKNKLFMDYK